MDAKEEEKTIPDGVTSVWVIGDLIHVRFVYRGKERSTVLGLEELAGERPAREDEGACPSGRCPL